MEAVPKIKNLLKIEILANLAITRKACDSRSNVKEVYGLLRVERIVPGNLWYP